MVATNSKSSKTTSTSKNTKPQSFERTFEPRLSPKTNKGALFLVGYDFPTYTYGRGTDKEKEVTKFEFQFLVLDATGTNPQTIGVRTSTKINETNLLGRTLKALGYEFKQAAEAIDPEEDDEFATVTTYDYADILEFLETKIGYSYTAYLPHQKNNPHLYDIDVDSLEPRISNKNGGKQIHKDLKDLFGNIKVTIISEADTETEE